MSELPPTETPAASSNGHGPEQGQDEPLRLGGMALRNGLLIHGPTAWSIAARNGRTGEVETATGSKPDFGGNAVAKVPLLRGPVRLAEAFAVIPIARKALPSARLPFEDPRVIGTAAAVSLTSSLLKPKPDSRHTMLREGMIAALGMAPATVALTGTELASYHGVEHKAIAAYEQGSRDPNTAPKEHDRCGSNLIAPLMVFTLAGQALLEKLVDEPGRVGRAVVSVGSLSLAVEAFAIAEKNPDSPLGRAVHFSGNSIQRLFATREPNDEQVEVGVAALDAILEAEGVSGLAASGPAAG